MSGIPDLEDFSLGISRSAPTQVIPRVVRRRKGKYSNTELDGGLPDTAVGPERAQARCEHVPGSHVLWTKTFGCAHNVSDGEYMVGQLLSYGYSFTERREDADLWLLNSCTVKDPSQLAFMHLVQSAEEQGKAVVVCGCVPQGERTLKGLEHVSMVGVQQIDRVVDVVEETLKGNIVRMLARGQLPALDLPKIRKNALIEIVPLSTGCLGACTYCKTKHARGELGSYSPKALQNRVASVIAEGITEVWLSSEDTGAYGRDIGTHIGQLLKLLLDTPASHAPTGHAGDVMLRLGMTNPPFILEHLPAVARALNHDNAFSFLHVPVQSGSDTVLKRMNREYTVADFERVCDFLLVHVPGLTISTDIICGFPGETDADWKDTMRLVRKYRFHILNISQFYARAGTAAARMKRVDTKVVKARSREITAWLDTLEPFKHWIGTRHQVWIGTEIDNSGRYIVAHTKCYSKVLLPRDDTLRGATAYVEVTATKRWHMEAKVLKRTFTSSQTQALLGSTTGLERTEPRVGIATSARTAPRVVSVNTMRDTTISDAMSAGVVSDPGANSVDELHEHSTEFSCTDSIGKSALDLSCTGETAAMRTISDSAATGQPKGSKTRRPWRLILALFMSAFALVVYNVIISPANV
eukprot:g1098.t1